MPTETPDPAALEWFELEVSPRQFRLALLPGQPVLLGSEGEGGAPGALYLVPTEEFPTQVAGLRSELLALLDASGVLSTPCAHPEKTFTKASMAARSTHIRVQKGGQRYQLCWEGDDVPAAAREFCERAASLGTRWATSLPRNQITGAEALAVMKSRNRSNAVVVTLMPIIVALISMLATFWCLKR
jgi:hypothetical protein